MLKFSILLVALSLLLAGGCGEEKAPETTAQSGAGISAVPTSGPGVPDVTPSSDVKVINDPAQAPKGQGYIIKPANPNDPKYQADPRLGGGGG